MTDTPQRTAPLYRNGTWEETPDVVSQVWDEDINQDFDDVLRKTGFDPNPWNRLGDPDLPRGLALVIHRRDGQSPEFLVEVNTSSGMCHMVYTAQVHDVIDLMTRWAPVIQAGAITEVVNQLLEYGPEEHHKSQLVRALEQIKKA